jgi:hypothetical protein
MESRALGLDSFFACLNFYQKNLKERRSRLFFGDAYRCPVPIFRYLPAREGRLNSHSGFPFKVRPAVVKTAHRGGPPFFRKWSAWRTPLALASLSRYLPPAVGYCGAH